LVLAARLGIPSTLVLSLTLALGHRVGHQQHVPASHVKPLAQPHLARPTHNTILRTGNAAHRAAALRTATLRTASIRAAARAAAAAAAGPRELDAPDRMAVKKALPHALPLRPGRGDAARTLRARHRRVRRHLVRKSK